MTPAVPKPTGMSRQDEALMGAPSLKGSWCVVCGSHKVEDHHVVLRSRGGAEGPTITLCRNCHARAHRQVSPTGGPISFEYRDGKWWVGL
jgi:hypothetical protein